MAPFWFSTEHHWTVLKTHICDKWVCGTETNVVRRRCLISFRTLYCWMWIERVQRASVQFDILNGRLRPALDLELCSLARWTRSICIQQNGGWKGIARVIIGMLVSVLQTHYWWSLVFNALPVLSRRYEQNKWRTYLLQLWLFQGCFQVSFH